MWRSVGLQLGKPTLSFSSVSSGYPTNFTKHNRLVPSEKHPNKSSLPLVTCFHSSRTVSAPKRKYFGNRVYPMNEIDRNEKWVHKKVDKLEKELEQRQKELEKEQEDNPRYSEISEPQKPKPYAKLKQQVLGTSHYMLLLARKFAYEPENPSVRVGLLEAAKKLTNLLSGSAFHDKKLKLTVEDYAKLAREFENAEGEKVFVSPFDRTLRSKREEKSTEGKKRAPVEQLDHKAKAQQVLERMKSQFDKPKDRTPNKKKK